MASVPIVAECTTAATSPTTTIQTVLPSSLLGSAVSPKARQSTQLSDADVIALLCIDPRHIDSQINDLWLWRL